jgi:hypothetical protein
VTDQARYGTGKIQGATEYYQTNIKKKRRFDTRHDRFVMYIPRFIQWQIHQNEQSGGTQDESVLVEPNHDTSSSTQDHTTLLEGQEIYLQREPESNELEL